MSYNYYPQGSTWNRWDLHIHAPGTKKNNQFIGSSQDEKWQLFFDKLSTLRDIRVIGITDYFCIDDYLKVAKYKEEGNLDNIDLILPNVELRLSHTTYKGKKINLHAIFSPEIVPELENIFFSNLTFSYQDEIYKCTKPDLIKLGKQVNNETVDDISALKIGINQFEISLDSLKKILRSSKTLRSNTIIAVASGNNDGVSALRDSDDTSAFTLIKKEIIRFSDIIFSGSPKDHEFFLGHKPGHTSDKIIKDYGKLKPCAHGSDAHSLEEICMPDENRYCWIKSEPTFEGLKQVIHEPADRIRVQEEKPEEKHKSEIISKVRFKDCSGKYIFSEEDISLNHNLNTIIGGKSTGKSLLIDYINSTISPDTAPSYDFKDVDFEVEWGDGEVYRLKDTKQVKNRNITFIPQLYVEKILRENKDEFNEIVLKTLKEKNEFIQIYNTHITEKRQKTVDIDKDIAELMNEYKSLSEDKEELNGLGDKEAKSNEVTAILESIQNLRKNSGLTVQELQSFEDLKNQELSLKKELHEKKEITTGIEELLDRYANEILMILDSFNKNVSALKNRTNPLYHEYIDRVDNNLKINTAPYVYTIEDMFEDKNLILDNINIINNDIVENMSKQEPLAGKISSQAQINDLESEIKRFKSEIDHINYKEKQIKYHLEKVSNKKSNILDTYKLLRKSYSDIVEKINTSYGNIFDDGGIKLIASYTFNHQSFWDKFINLFNLKSTSFISLFNNDEENLFSEVDKFNYSDSNHDKLLEKGFDILTNTNHKKELKFKGTFANIDALKGLLQDYFEINFTIEQEGDDISKMSPGKKGLILLKLFLSLKNEKSPILIDQPEDNLDNRTIYNELKDYIKKKKIQRQIIMVTHNANLAVSTDAELVIVASQSGQDNKENKKYKFEYISGGLEHNFPKDTREIGILYQMGVREHVCEILEGGQEAFEKREAKYGFNYKNR